MVIDDITSKKSKSAQLTFFYFDEVDGNDITSIINVELDNESQNFFQMEMGYFFREELYIISRILEIYNTEHINVLLDTSQDQILLYKLVEYYYKP